MPNPRGYLLNVNDQDIWVLPFSFTIGAAGAITSKSLPREIRDITRTGAGAYTTFLRERGWVEPLGFDVHAIVAAKNEGQIVALDLNNALTPGFNWVLFVESAGTHAAADAGNPATIYGSVTLRNKLTK